MPLGLGARLGHLFLLLMFITMLRNSQGFGLGAVRPLMRSRMKGLRMMSLLHKHKFASIEDKVFASWKTMNLSPRATILMNISGGMDSIAMLHILQAIRRRYLPDLDLKVVHFNHKKRAASTEEALFVERLARENKLDFYSFEWNTAAEKMSSNFQEAARNWRRSESTKILSSIANANGAYIATAHHADDQIETILLKLLRGTFISNIQGMELVDEEAKVIHPMLAVNKRDIESYLRDNSFEWREDESNQSFEYKRNQVRNQLIPLLSDICGGSQALESRMQSLMLQSQQLSPLLDQIAATTLRSIEYRCYWQGYHTMLFRCDVQSLSPLVLGNLIHSWIQRTTGLVLTYAVLHDVLNLFQILKDRQRVAATLSHLWDVELVGSELRLIHRSGKRPPIDVTSDLVVQGASLRIRHPRFVKLFANRAEAGESAFKVYLPVNNSTSEFIFRFAEVGEKWVSRKDPSSTLQRSVSQLAQVKANAPAHERDRVLLVTDDKLGRPLIAIISDGLIDSEPHVLYSNSPSDAVSVWVHFDYPAKNKGSNENAVHEN